MAETTEKKFTSKRWALKNPEHVRRLLTSTVNKLLAGSISVTDGRGIGFLCNILITVFAFQKENNLDARIEKLEQLLAAQDETDDEKL